MSIQPIWDLTFAAINIRRWIDDYFDECRQGGQQIIALRSVDSFSTAKFHCTASQHDIMRPSCEDTVQFWLLALVEAIGHEYN